MFLKFAVAERSLLSGCK